MKTAVIHRDRKLTRVELSKVMSWAAEWGTAFRSPCRLATDAVGLLCMCYGAKNEARCSNAADEEELLRQLERLIYVRMKSR